MLCEVVDFSKKLRRRETKQLVDEWNICWPANCGNVNIDFNRTMCCIKKKLQEKYQKRDQDSRSIEYSIMLSIPKSETLFNKQMK